MKSIDKAQLKELLNKCWMTHDGMWFFHCFKEFGIEAANKLNKASIKSLAGIEIKRISEAFDIKEIKKFDDILKLLQAVEQTVVADFMGFQYDSPSENHLHAEMPKCFAYDGIKRIGAIERYECGIFFRVECWLDALGIQYAVSPTVKGCMKHERGSCFRDYTFYF